MSEAPIDVQAGLDRYRDVRKQLEEQVLPLATSVDGRRFTYQTSLFGLAVQAGSYVALEQGSERRLGQIVTLEVARRPTLELGSGDGGETAHRAQVVIRAAEGEGRVLSGDGTSFHDAAVRPATPDEVREHLEATAPKRAQLEIGELLLAERSSLRARRRRLRAPHVPLRPVGLGQDLLARRRARAAAARD